MKSGSVLFMGLLGLGVVAGTAQAEIFTWVDESGTTNFSQAPSSQVFRSHRVNIVSDRPPAPILGGIEEVAPMTPAEGPGPDAQPAPADGEEEAAPAEPGEEGAPEEEGAPAAPEEGANENAGTE